MASAGFFSVSALRRDPTIRPNTFVAGVNLGGLKPDEAQFKLRAWWEGERVKKLTLKSASIKKPLPEMTPGQLGLTIDDAATVGQLPMSELMGGLTSEEATEKHYEPVYKPLVVDLTPLRKAIEDALPDPRPARVVFTKGHFIRKPEVAGLKLDETRLTTAIQEGVKAGSHTVELPIVEAPKAVPDTELAKITELVSAFTTHFPRNPNRTNNIRLAAGKLNGVVLAPGQRMSFNETVGRRTVEAGFMEAGVYKNGKHDTGIGGGICQVSTTLYNASLFANLKIVRRQNHSMPVAYVPLGRDATVDYGSRDLVIENNYEIPIAVNSEYHPNSLTFRIFGKKTPGLSVKIERYGESSWGAPTRTTYDPTLPAGRRRIVQKGSSGRSIYTTRVVSMNGKVVKREPLGRSYYAGGIQIVAIGTAKPKVKKVVPTPPTVGVDTTDAPIESPNLDGQQ